MKVQRIKIRNFKVVKDLEKEINGGNIILCGDNGVGKSSVIQFIKIALGDTSNIPPDAEGSGLVVVGKNGKEYTFKLHFKNNKPVVEVTSPDGLKDTRKGVIAELVGAVDFDIDEFVNLSDTTAGRKKQVEIYRSLLDTETKEFLTREENKIDSYYQERTEINREIKSLEGFIKTSPLYGEDLNIKKVDVAELQSSLQKANDHNRKIREVKQRKEERASKIAQNILDIEELQQKINKLKSENQDFEEKNLAAEKWLSTNSEIDTKELSDKIEKASEINAKAIQAVELNANIQKLKALEEKAQDFTVVIETGRQAIQDAIRDMNPIVEGLTFDMEQLLYNGVPVSTASLSTSEIIHLGIKLKMAKNPELGILFIERGESIGAKRLKEIQQLAKENDWQIILEQVERGQEELKIEIMGE